MSSTDWEKVKQAFSAALGVPAGQRDAYVDAVCADRVDLRDAVKELLSAHTDASQGFLEPESLVFRATWLFQTNDLIAERFRVVKPIARGANGEVYHVFDEALRLSVALKAIRPELIGDADTIERFKREVRITRDIVHDGLCRVFDLVEHRVSAQPGLIDGAVIPCLTMQLLDGISLEDWLAAHRPLPIREALPLIRQIAETLQVLHDAGIIHRDLKPSNVMLVSLPSGERRAVITDFGLAKPIDEGIFETQGPMQGGAPFYMAPELFEGARPSRASDIYAFGLLIDEMVTRERAFAADSLHALLLQKMGDGPVHPSRRAEQLPRAWDAAILRCLLPNPGSRCTSVGAVMAELEGRSRWLWLRRFSPVSHVPRRWRVALYASAVIAALAGVAIAGATPGDSASVRIDRFKNLTPQTENDYLATGTTAELGRRLSRVGSLHVYMPADASADVAPSKRAMFSLSGHIQQDGPTIRITAELLRSSDGSLAWSQNFEGSLERAIDLQDRLSVAAVSALTKAAASDSGRAALPRVLSWLGVETLMMRRTALPAAITTNSEAFDAYMRGRYLYEERTLPSALAAIDHLNRAVQLDPNFAGAFATLADVQQVLMDTHYAPHSQLLAEAERFALTAVSIDPNLPDAQLSLAAVRQAQSRWDEAERAYRTALDLHPSFARAKRWFGGMLLQFGQFDESLQLIEEGLALDPYDFPNRSAYGLALFYARRPTDAAAYLEKLLSEKDLFNAHAVLGQVYAFLSGTAAAGRPEYLAKALAQSELLRQSERGGAANASAARTEYADLVGALAWSYSGDSNSAQPFLNRLEIGRAARQVSPSMLARVYAVQKRASDALSALEDAEVEQDRELMYLAVSPLYDAIRAEPRFRELVTRKRLPL